MVHVKKDAKLYLKAAGSERAGPATERRFSDGYLDPELLCSPYGGPSSPDPRRYGLRRDWSAEPFAYVDIGDVVIPSTAVRIGTCL